MKRYKFTSGLKTKFVHITFLSIYNINKKYTSFKNKKNGHFGKCDSTLITACCPMSWSQEVIGLVKHKNWPLRGNASLAVFRADESSIPPFSLELWAEPSWPFSPAYTLYAKLG